jgi:uncharacterized protein YndB with AHSA1/START domain
MKIHKESVLKAPLDRVWAAISDARQFGAWFGMELDGPFEAGKKIIGRIAPTQVDPEVAKLQEPHAGAPVELWIETIEPKRLFSLRWHPFATDKSSDYSNEPTTLIELALSEVPGGTKLVITESGFENIPLARRAEAFKANEGGWAHQLELIAKYLAR